MEMNSQLEKKLKKFIIDTYLIKPEHFFFNGLDLNDNVDLSEPPPPKTVEDIT